MQQIADHYARLFQNLAKKEWKDAVEVSLQELADILCCTPRNVHLVLKRMAQAGWIEWQPGRGRGKRSVLTFLQSLDVLYLEWAQELVRMGNVSEALMQMNRFAVSTPVTKQFFEWLHGQFGYQVETEAHKQLDTLRFRFYRPLAGIDPAQVGRRTEAHMVRQAYDTLVAYNPATGEMEGRIAHAWETSADGTEWVFYLRKGVQFHHGLELTAKDAAFTLNRLMDEKTNAPHRWLFEGIEEVEAVREFVLRVKLREPNHLFLNFLSKYWASILPHNLAETGRDITKLPLGTGPFSFVRNDEEKIVLEAFPAYWEGRAHLDRVEIWIVPRWSEEEGDDEPYERNGMQYVSGRRPGGVTEWRESSQLEKGGKYLTFNCKKAGPQQDAGFRRLLRRLLDPQLIPYGNGRARQAYGWLPEAKPCIDEEPVPRLEETAYDGRVLKLHTYELTSNREDALWIQDLARQAGIAIDVQVFSAEEMRKQACMDEADLILSGEVIDADVELSLLSLYQRADSPVKNHLSPSLADEFSRRLAEVAATPSRAERMRLLQAVEERLWQTCSVLFFYHMQQTTWHHPSLKGVEMNASGLVEYKNLWFASL